MIIFLINISVMFDELSVIIPLHNKAHSIESTVNKLSSTNLFTKLQIIIVENESTDNSLDVAKGIAKSYINRNNIEIKILKSSKGKGNAIRKGIPEIKFKWCLITGADLPFGLSDIKNILKEKEINYDLYLGSKSHPKSNIKRKFSRVVYSFIFLMFRKVFLKLNYLDTHGSMIIKSKYLKSISHLLTQEQFFIDTEIVFLANKLNIGIKEVPIILEFDDQLTTVRPLKDGAHILFETIKLGLKKH